MIWWAQQIFPGVFGSPQAASLVGCMICVLPVIACTVSLIKCLSWIIVMTSAQWAMFSAVLNPSEVFLRAFFALLMHVFGDHTISLTLTTWPGPRMSLINGMIATAFVTCTATGEARSAVSLPVSQHGQTRHMLKAHNRSAHNICTKPVFRRSAERDRLVTPST